MKIRKAVITAAARSQRSLPLQTLIDRDGAEKSVLGILIEEALRAHIDEICVVVWPGDEPAFRRVAGDHEGRLRFVSQPEPLGYGHAIHCAREFVGKEPFLHLVGDHIYVSRGGTGCAEQLVEIAEDNACAVSSVQETRETLLPYYGAIGGRRLPVRDDLYSVDTVLEKPTPTEAEQRLVVPGLRAGHYLCFFGMHALPPTVMGILDHLASGKWAGVTLSAALSELARREQYLGLEQSGRRYDLGAKYGLLTAQLALALSGRDRDQVLSELVEFLAVRELGAAAR